MQTFFLWIRQLIPNGPNRNLGSVTGFSCFKHLKNIVAYPSFSFIRGTSRSDQSGINVVSTLLSSSAKPLLAVKVSSNGLGYKKKIVSTWMASFVSRWIKSCHHAAHCNISKFFTHKYHTNLCRSGKEELCCLNIKLLRVDIIGVKGVTTSRHTEIEKKISIKLPGDAAKSILNSWPWATGDEHCIECSGANTKE